MSGPSYFHHYNSKANWNSTCDANKLLRMKAHMHDQMLYVVSLLLQKKIIIDVKFWVNYHTHTHIYIFCMIYIERKLLYEYHIIWLNACIGISYTLAGMIYRNILYESVIWNQVLMMVKWARSIYGCLIVLSSIRRLDWNSMLWFDFLACKVRLCYLMLCCWYYLHHLYLLAIYAYVGKGIQPIWIYYILWS